MTDAELDTLVRHVKEQKPNAGLRYVVGFFRKQGLKIQQKRVRSSLSRMDGVGQALRTRRPIHRRQYHVPRPNSLWHMDGHHKLIRWGIVIHGIVDGYCRTVSNLFESMIFSYFISLSRLSVSRQTPTTEHPPCYSCFWRPLESTDLPPRCVVIEEERMLM